MDIEVFESSQGADFSKIDQYAVIFVDIDLAPKSHLDGYGVIQKIKNLNPNLPERTVILTGNNKVIEAMLERQVYSPQIKIIVKPTNYKVISDTINAITP